MANLPIDKINEIQNSVDIVDVISRYINVVRKGKNYFAICPFHNDTNPSLSISREKQIFKCFVCNEGGNVFTFVSKYKGIGFMEAVKEVADIANIPFEIEKKSKPIVDVKKQVLYNILEDTTKYYQSVLASNKEAIEYLNKRDISRKINYEFKIGFSQDFEGLIKYLELKQYSRKDIFRSGVALENDGTLRDRFSQRLIFPITDLFGHVVGFSGRIINQNNDMAKYVNSPENEVFFKGDTFYHYADALAEIKKQKKVYVCEGFMDVIALYKCNIPNAIALMGTAHTKTHLKTLKFLNVEVILTLDGDSAGNLAAYTFATELFNLNINVKVVPNYRDVKDLDEFNNKYGKNELLNHLNQSALSFFDYVLYYKKATTNLENFEERKNLAKKLCDFIANKDEVERGLYINKLATELKYPEATIRKIVDGILKKNDSQTPNGNYFTNKKLIQNYSQDDKTQLTFLYTLLSSNEAIKYFLEEYVYLPQDRFRILANYILECYNEDNNFNVASLYTYLENTENASEMLKALDEVMDFKKEGPKFSKESYDQLFYQLKEIIPLQTKIANLKDKLAYTTNKEELNAIVSEHLKCVALLKEKRRNGR